MTFGAKKVNHMNVPEPLPNETPKAYMALTAYVEQGDKRTISKVARQLSKSRQLIVRWATKYRWKARLAAQVRHEHAQKINAEEQARAQVAVMSEESKSAAVRDVFRVARSLIALASHNAKTSIDTTQSLNERRLAASNAARFFTASADLLLVMSDAGGVASDYAVPVGAQMQLNVVQQMVEQAPKPILTIEDANAILEDEGYDGRAEPVIEQPEKTEGAPTGGDGGSSNRGAADERTVPARGDEIPLREHEAHRGHLDVREEEEPVLPFNKMRPEW
jgi:hypothetical protein